MAGVFHHELELSGGRPVLRLRGDIRRQVVNELVGLLRRPDGETLTVDLSAVEYMDSAAVAALVSAWRRARARGGGLVVESPSEAAQRALSLFRFGEDVQAPPSPPGSLESVGDGLLGAGASIRDFTVLSGRAFLGVINGLRRPATLRGEAVIEQSIYIGSQALPIIVLLSFLVGLVLALQSAYQLRQFGAAIYVANLTGVAMLREMGPLLTGILVAGRSGSSIAAEISTMKVSEEIDALQVMGIEPVAWLAVPRLIAITMVMPLLTILADLAGVFGGFVIGIGYLDIAWNAYLSQTLDSLVLKDVVTGVIKSIAFAWGICLIGLFYGFRVRGGAGEVGRTTTASVVTSIFFIIVADAAFSVLFYILI